VLNRTQLSRRLVLGGAASLALAPFARARAAVAGGKTITLLVSYPPGGGADLIARLIAPKLAEQLGQPVVVENRAGASGTIAAGQVARAAPDGSTLLLDASSFAVNPALFNKLPYDTNTAFTPLAVLTLFPNVLVCTPSFEAQSVADVLRLARSKPQQIAYASSGNGSAQHLAGALFEDLAKVELNHVPYRGGGPALTDVMAGQVPLFFANVASSLGHIQAGKLRPLALTAWRASGASRGSEAASAWPNGLAAATGGSAGPPPARLCARPPGRPGCGFGRRRTGLAGRRTTGCGRRLDQAQRLVPAQRTGALRHARCHHRPRESTLRPAPAVGLGLATHGAA
jgi:tripartite-type tricarboxylate transporter receptor subunit TctC